jgi:hypothetical protein
VLAAELAGDGRCGFAGGSLPPLPGGGFVAGGVEFQYVGLSHDRTLSFGFGQALVGVASTFEGCSVRKSPA